MKSRFFLLVIFAISLASCAPQFKTIPQEVVSKMDADLKSGNSSLSDGVGPLYSWVSDFRQLVIFYNSAQWNSLAFSVMQIGYANDIAYYFLGSSAEGLGYYDAALKYYNMSKEFYSDPHRTHHCRDSAEGCGGLRLDVLIPTKMDIVQQRLASLNSVDNQSLQGTVHVVDKSSTGSDVVRNNIWYISGNEFDFSDSSIENMKFALSTDETVLDKNPKYEFVQYKNGKNPDGEGKIISIGCGEIDNSKSTAVIFTRFVGGNTISYNIGIITKDNGKYKINQAVLNGYGVEFDKVQIKKNVIVVFVKYRGPGDPMCCPTKKGTIELKLVGNKIIEKKNIKFPRAW